MRGRQQQKNVQVQAWQGYQQGAVVELVRECVKHTHKLEHPMPTIIVSPASPNAESHCLPVWSIADIDSR